jgi:CBS domain-containing protein
VTRIEIQEAQPLREDDRVADAVRALRDSGLPALPVVGGDGKLTGLFGEREFFQALFPGYVGELGYAGFVHGRLDDVLEKRAACSAEPVSEHMNTEHVSVQEDFSDVGVAEVFLHHRVLIVPVERDGRPIGVVTRSAFFARLADRFLERTAT